jgi:arginine/lysine/ornithine decarboxylase
MAKAAHTLCLAAVLVMGSSGQDIVRACEANGDRGPKAAAEEGIPFSRPYTTDKEAKNVAYVLGGGGSMQTHHTFGPECERRLERELGARRVLLVGSGTGALELSAIITVGAGDEVIMPSFTFVSTANAFVLAGAVPVFVDIRADTQNIDERRIEEAITERTRAICVVHYAGVPCEMDAIMEVMHDPMVDWARMCAICTRAHACAKGACRLLNPTRAVQLFR